MNRRQFNTAAAWTVAASGLLIPTWTALARTASNVQFRPGADYWLKTAIRIANDQEWDGSPILAVMDGDTTVWSWCVNQYNEDDPVHCEVTTDALGDHCYGPWSPITPGPWHEFTWHLRFSTGDDGVLEGWWSDQKILSVWGANCEYDQAEFTYAEPANPAVHFSRVNWRVG